MSIEQRVIKVVECYAFSEEVTPNSHMDDDLNMDSLDTVETIMGIEEEFDIEISDDILEEISYVKDIVEVVIDLLSKEGI